MNTALYNKAGGDPPGKAQYYRGLLEHFGHYAEVQ